ncbi:hypothetical protein [Thiolapillus sp.]|uniref:hypothetical protein n=2 Tax=Thiolapillus sp. TaxID=2017437 RepID=UPI0025D3D0E0|nr:hypothetical protein [Thiolapillus sp.]
MLTIIQYPLETGIVIALLVYGLILAWNLLARLKWLPVAVVRPIYHVLTRLGQLPLLGRAVRATRRHPLSLGLVPAILTGTLVPVLLISMYALFSALVVGVILLLAFRYGDWKEEPEEEHALYHSYDSEEPIVSSNHPSAIKDWPASLL